MHIASTEVLRRHGVVLRSSRFGVAMALQVDRQMYHTLRRQPVRRSKRRGHDQGNRPVGYQVSLTLKVFQGLVLKDFYEFLHDVYDVYNDRIHSSSRLGFLTSVLSCSSYVLFEGFSILPS